MASILFSIPGEKKQYKCPTDADAVSLGGTQPGRLRPI